MEFENLTKKLKEKDRLIETLYLEKKENKKWKNDFLILLYNKSVKIFKSGLIPY